MNAPTKKLTTLSINTETSKLLDEIATMTRISKLRLLEEAVADLYKKHRRIQEIISDTV